MTETVIEVIDPAPALVPVSELLYARTTGCIQRLRRRMLSHVYGQVEKLLMQARRYALSLRYQDADNENDNTFYKGMLTTPFHPYAKAGLGLIATALSKPVLWATPIGEFRLLLNQNKGVDPKERAT
jgi:hypothetical protein